MTKEQMDLNKVNAEVISQISNVMTIMGKNIVDLQNAVIRLKIQIDELKKGTK